MPLDFSLPSPVEKKAGEVLDRIADHKLLDAERRYLRIHSVDATIELVLREPADHVSPESWGIHPPEFQDRMIWNSEMMGDLKQLAPQALLRDLFRPVRDDIRHAPEPVDAMTPQAVLAERTPTLEVMKWQPLPEVRSSILAIEEADQHRRSIYTEDWQTVKDDSEPRTAYSEFPLSGGWGQPSE